ncbi:MAG TPA: lipid A biosynthesis acyltransferase, partial [Phnomibacter sp.]|nr:lipid A biosynthesis acyltransferase [Phnomibacter sp.]
MYWVVFGLLYLLSLLPLWLLYGASNVVSFLLFNVFGYRRKVVEGNLAHAFPEKTARERRQIAQAFYRNFIDNWIETLKLLSISKKQLSKRVTANVQVFQELYQTGKAVQVNLGHFFNWEMMSMHLGLCQPYPVVAVYLPQSSGIFNRLLKHVRSRWGNALVAST